MTDLRTTTPSQRAGIRVTPRMPPFQFEPASFPEAWFDGDDGITAAWNALSVVAAAAEGEFMDAGRWLLDRIDDPDVAAETRAFIQQEASHSAVHGRFNECLAQRGLPVTPLTTFSVDVFTAMEAYGGRSVQLSAGLAGEQLIGEMGHVVLARPESMQGAAEAPRALWMWHWYEEVEHQAALHDGWVHVHGQSRDARAQRVLGAAYILVLLLAVWPVATWAMLPPARGAKPSRARSVSFRPLMRQLFGREGLLIPAFKNLTALARVDFHPFQLHDPVPTLERWRDQVTDPSWERRAPSAGRHGGLRSEIAPPRVGARDLLQLVRFTGFAATRALQFARAVRGQRASSASTAAGDARGA